MVEPQHHAPAGQCADGETAKQLLEKITKQINDFESLRLKELKTDLDTFVKKQDDLDKEYKKQYPALRERWCAQQQSIETLHAALTCAFPNNGWKQIVADCVCKPLACLGAQERAVAQRRRCCAGPLEHTRDLKKDRYERSKTRLDTLSANAGKIQSALGDNEKLINEIRDLLPRPDKAVALYLFFFKLLPMHKQLMPEDVGAECQKFGDGQRPEDLCKDVAPDKSCKIPENQCAPPGKDGDGKYDDAKGTDKPPHPVPWLILPQNYRGELDCAWQDVRADKAAFGAAETAYTLNPDDLGALSKLVEGERKKLDDAIRQCLKDKAQTDRCCTSTTTQTPPTQQQPTPPAAQAKSDGGEGNA